MLYPKKVITYDEKNALNLSLFAPSLSIHTIGQIVLNRTSSPARIPDLNAITSTHITLATIVIIADIPFLDFVRTASVSLTASKYSAQDIEPTRSFVKLLESF